MKNFFTKYGLLKRWSFEGETIENEFGYGFRYMKLKKFNHENYDTLKTRVEWFLKNMHCTRMGLKNHLDPEILERHPKLSHDQFKFAICASVELGEWIHKILWEDTKFFKYKGSRISFRDWAFLAMVNNSWLALPFLPWMIISLLYTFLIKYDLRVRKSPNQWSEHYKVIEFKLMLRVSGPLLWWDVIYALRGKGARFWKIKISYYGLLNWMFKKLVKFRFGTFRKMFEKFFYELDNPTVKTFYPNYYWESYETKSA